MGVTEFSSIFYTYNAAGRAAYDVSRQLATNQINGTQAPEAARAQLPSWVRSKATITASFTSTDPTTNRFTVAVSFPASSASPTNVLGWAYRTLTLKATSTMQQEPTS